MGAIAGSLHHSTQPAPFCPSHPVALWSFSPSVARHDSPLSSPHCGAAGLLLGGEVDATP